MLSVCVSMEMALCALFVKICVIRVTTEQKTRNEFGSVCCVLLLLLCLVQ